MKKRPVCPVKEDDGEIRALITAEFIASAASNSALSLITFDMELPDGRHTPIRLSGKGRRERCFRRHSRRVAVRWQAGNTKPCWKTIIFYEAGNT